MSRRAISGEGFSKAERAVTPTEPCPDPGEDVEATEGRATSGPADPEATAALHPDDTLTPPPPRPTLPGPARDLGFLDPPRADGELGWMAHYRVVRPIGEGGMGLVFQAVDTHLLRPVALKVIRPELADVQGAKDRFLREARAAAAIKHDHIVTIYQVGQQREVAFLAMEFLQGVSLQRWLERGKSPSIDLALRIGREVASGLAAAHRIGLIHRDIKPGNIWLEAPNGRAKILDFGHARAIREDVEITHAGTILGTPAYMAPEQARGEPADASSDLFSLGCVLYRLLTGRLPFEGRTILAVLTALATETPPSPRTLNPATPQALDDLVMRLLSKTPADRPASAQAVVEAIRGIERQLAADRQSAELSPVPLSLIEVAPETLDSARERSGPSRIGGLRRGRGVVWAIVATTLTLVVVGAALIARTTSSKAPGSISIPRAKEGVAPSPAPPAPIPPPAPPAKEVEPKQAPADIARPEPVAPKPEPPVTPKPEPKKPAVPVDTTPPIGPWNLPVDPDGDCTVSLGPAPGAASIRVPGTAHLLSVQVELNRVNAPRVLRDVRGDFEVRVRVAGVETPAGRSTMKAFQPYHGAGLLIWQDPNNYIRLESATELRLPPNVTDFRRAKPFRYANFEAWKDGRFVWTKGIPIEDRTTYLRLERVGKVVHASFGPDGVHWTPFPPLDAALDDRLQVGLTAISTAQKPLVADFHDFQVIPIPAAPPAKPVETPRP